MQVELLVRVARAGRQGVGVQLDVVAGDVHHPQGRAVRPDLAGIVIVAVQTQVFVSDAVAGGGGSEGYRGNLVGLLAARGAECVVGVRRIQRKVFQDGSVRAGADPRAASRAVVRIVPPRPGVVVQRQRRAGKRDRAGREGRYNWVGVVGDYPGIAAVHHPHRRAVRPNAFRIDFISGVGQQDELLVRVARAGRQGVGVHLAV